MSKSKRKQKHHIFIATPMYGGMCTGKFTASLLKLIPTIEMKGWRYSFLFRFNESLIDRARNALTANFLMSDATHLLFIDSDIGFEAEDIIRMVEADKDIICGIYPSKTINWQTVSDAVKKGVPPEQLTNFTGKWVVNMKAGRENVAVNINEPFEVWDAGTGMMLIRRNVFEKLMKTVESYRVNEDDPMMKKFLNGNIPRFFATSIDPVMKVLLSEDYHFCRLWREAGGTIWAAPWTRLTHTGTYNFEGRPITE